MAKSTCVVVENDEVCGRPCFGHGMCSKHYQRQRRSGSTADPRELCKRKLHEMTDENTYVDPLGKRNCRACVSERLANRQAPPCKIDGCDGMSVKRGWCEMHYRRYQRDGDPGGAEPKRHAPGTLRCTVEGCEREDYYAGGLCALHYQRMWRIGATDLPVIDRPEFCTVDGCDLAVLAQGLCRKHYLRVWRTGSADDPVPVTHCAKGHEFTAENTCIYAGKRYCRTCQAAKGAARREWMDATQTELVDYGVIIEIHGMTCHICHAAIEGMDDLHMDHVIPRARGGTHTYDNIRPAHQRCNLRKHDKLMSELGTLWAS